MRIVRIAAVVLAILGGMFALLGYAAVFRDKGGSEAVGYGWLVFTGVLAILGGALAALSHPQDGSMSERTCPRCGRQAQEDWTLCPTCGTRLPHSIHEVAPRRRGGERVEEGRAAEDYEPENGLLGKALFWLGIVVLDVLFVLFVLWLFVPSLVLSQKIFWSMGGPLGIVVLDIGIGCILVGYSLIPSSAIRL